MLAEAAIEAARISCMKTYENASSVILLVQPRDQEGLCRAHAEAKQGKLMLRCKFYSFQAGTAMCKEYVKHSAATGAATGAATPLLAQLT